MPIFLQGMGGPGAPHVFRLERRDMLGHLAVLMVLKWSFEINAGGIVLLWSCFFERVVGEQQKSNLRKILQTC